MDAKSTRRRWTYAEFARLPTSGSRRYEVIAGKVCVTPSPTSKHQRVVAKLLSRLFVFAEAHDLGQVFPGPLDVLFAEGDYLEPDILFIRRGRSHLMTDRGVEGPPDLVVEVLSPSTAARDRGIKLDRYRLYGVPVYWVVNPDERRVEVWQFAEGTSEAAVLGLEDTLQWTPVKGAATLEIRLSKLFETE